METGLCWAASTAAETERSKLGGTVLLGTGGGKVGGGRVEVRRVGRLGNVGGLVVEFVVGGLVVELVVGGRVVELVVGGLVVELVVGGLVVELVVGGLVVELVVGGLVVEYVVGGGG